MVKADDIKRKRKAEGLTVQELSEKLKVSKANLYKWEKGHKPANPEDYIKLENWLKDKVESVPQETVETIPQEPAKPVSQQDGLTLQAIVNLTESNNKLTRMLEKVMGRQTGSDEVLENQSILIAYQKTIFEHLAHVEARLDKRKVDDVAEEMGKSLNAYFDESRKRGS